MREMGVRGLLVYCSDYHCMPRFGRLMGKVVRRLLGGLMGKVVRRLLGGRRPFFHDPVLYRLNV